MCLCSVETVGLSFVKSFFSTGRQSGSSREAKTTHTYLLVSSFCPKRTCDHCQYWCTAAPMTCFLELLISGKNVALVFSVVFLWVTVIPVVHFCLLHQRLYMKMDKTCPLPNTIQQWSQISWKWTLPSLTENFCTLAGSRRYTCLINHESVSAFNQDFSPYFYNIKWVISPPPKKNKKTIWCVF